MSGSNPPRGDVFLPLVYDELRRLAAHYLRAERADHTLQPTALVHEAFLRLRKLNRIPIQDRRHFVALAARVMRNVLVEHARAHGAAKRGGMLRRVTSADPGLRWASSIRSRRRLNSSTLRCVTDSAMTRSRSSPRAPTSQRADFASDTLWGLGWKEAMPMGAGSRSASLKAARTSSGSR